MADKMTERGMQDRTRINVDQDYELRYWSKELNVTEEQLRQAVKQVGPMVERVKAHLGSKAA